MKIPSNYQWTQTNNGRIVGILNETHNANLDAQGEMHLSRKALALVDSGTANFSDVMSIVYFDGDYHIVTDGKVFAGDLAGNDFDAVASSPDLGTVSDGIVCYSRLYVSDTTALAYLAVGGGWTTGIGSLTATYPHPLCVFDSQTTYKLAVGDGNAVKLYDSSGNLGATQLAVPSNFYVTSLVYSNGYLYVGTKEVNGGEAAIFLWNGDGTNAQYKIDVGAAWVYSMTTYRGSVVAVTNEGEIIALSGTSIVHLAAFPIFYAVGTQWGTGNATRGKIFSRGMVALGDVLYININGSIDGSKEVPGMKTGVWCFDPKVGLYHFASPSTDLWVADASLSLASNTITTSATHYLRTGDTIVFTASAITGITTNVVYYAIPVDATTLKVAATRQDAFDGNNMTISGTPGPTTLNYAPNTQFGQLNGENGGAIAVTNYLDSPINLFGSNLIWGSAIKNAAGTEKVLLCVCSDRYNEGSFVTQRIYSQNITTVWKSLTLYLSGLLGSVESAVVKVLHKERPLPTRAMTASWADTTTFSVTDFAARNIIEVGDEVEFVMGYGAGRLAHITALSQGAGTVSVTVDEAYGVAAGSSTVRFTPFKKLAEISSTREIEELSTISLDSIKSPWVQLKVELRGFEPSVAMMELTNSVDKSAA